MRYLDVRHHFLTIVSSFDENRCVVDIDPTTCIGSESLQYLPFGFSLMHDQLVPV